MSIFETKITPSVNIDTGEIRLMTENTAGQHYTEVIQTKDEATRAALITLGWTPPELKKYIFTVFDVEDDEEVDTYELLAASREFAFRIITHIEQEGGGEYCYAVIQVGEKFYKIEYSYYSYNGYDYDDTDVLEVVPTQRMVTFYE